MMSSLIEFADFRGPKEFTPGTTSRLEKRVLKRRQEREKYGLIANLNGCRYPIVRKVIEEAGFKADDSENLKSAYLIWTDTFIAFERLLTLKSFQRVNHFPGMIEICRKDFLAKNYNRQAKLDQSEYDYIPNTWIIPQEHSTFLAFAKRNPHSTYILKPANGAMGHGIRLYRQAEHVPINPIPNTACVVQEYITNPLLIDEYKFDLRVYVLVTSCSPLRIFVYNEGIVRLSAEKYMDPDEPNGESIFRHLTNYSVNKRHSNYVKTNDDTAGNKRSFSFLESYLREKLYADPQVVWRRIRNLIVKTMIIGAPHINHAYRLFHRSCGRSSNVNFSGEDVRDSVHGRSGTMPPQYRKSDRKRSASMNRTQSRVIQSTTIPDAVQFGIRSAAFEILGFDILLDRDLRPWLLEVNRSPSFGCDQDLDVKVKSCLLRDALHLINIRPSDKRRSEDAQKAHAIRRLLAASASRTQKFNSDHPPLSKKYSTGNLRSNVYVKSQDLATDWLQKPNELMQRIQVLKDRIHEMHQESELECFENTNCGNWRRIYPTSDRLLEQRYARLLTNCFNEFNKGKSGDLSHVIQVSHAGGQREDELRQQLEFLQKEALKLRSRTPTKAKSNGKNLQHCHFYNSKTPELWDVIQTDALTRSPSDDRSSTDANDSDSSNDQVSWALHHRVNNQFQGIDLLNERALAVFLSGTRDFAMPNCMQSSYSSRQRRRNPLCPSYISMRF